MAAPADSRWRWSPPSPPLAVVRASSRDGDDAARRAEEQQAGAASRARPTSVVRRLTPRSRSTRSCCWGSTAPTPRAPIVAELREAPARRGARRPAELARRAELVAAVCPRGSRRRPDPAADRRRPGGRQSTARSRTCPRPSARSTSATPRIAERAEAWASGDGACARRALGFDLNLFPVADVATLDSPVAGRAFSDDSVVAARADRRSDPRVRARPSIACAPLHFPGLGAAPRTRPRARRPSASTPPR